MKIVHGTAVASGIKVEGYEEWMETAVARAASSMNLTCTGSQHRPQTLQSLRCRSQSQSWTDTVQVL